MSVILRHKMFPFMIVYKDPKKNWDEIAKDRIIEEIKRDGFDNFTVIDWEKAELFLGLKSIVKKTKKKTKKKTNKETKKKTKKKTNQKKEK